MDQEMDQNVDNYRPFKDDTHALRTLAVANRQGIISRRAYLEAARVQRGPAEWLVWARFWLLVYGVALTLAGVLFFFAWNWPDMHRFEKFFLLELALLAAAGMAAWRGVHTLPGEAALVTAAVLTGVLMAVFGQVYQTGADAYELFRSWMVLILPWAIIAGSAALWILWTLVAVTAILTFAGQALDNDYFMMALTIAGLVPAALLALREGLLLAGRNWLPQSWLRPVLLFAALTLITLPVLAAITGASRSAALTAPSLGIGLLGIAGAYLVYRNCLRDMLALSMVIISVALIALFFSGEQILEASGGFNEGRLLLMAVIILGVVGGAYQWMRFDAQALADARRPASAGSNSDE